MKPFLAKTYFICTAPRSGSFLLGDGLAATQLAGRPEEFFDHSYEWLWCKRLGIESEAEYLPKVLAKGTSQNDVCGAKVLWYQLENLARHLGATDLSIAGMHAAISAAFPDLHYIRLTRRDQVAQAVSYYKAVATDVWWVIPTVKIEPKAIPEFDAEQIKFHRQLIQQYEQGWQEYFRVGGIKPYDVVYEDIVADYPGTIRDVLAFLGIQIPPSFPITEPRFVRQADAESDEWIARFRELEEIDQAPALAAPGCLEVGETSKTCQGSS